MTQKQHQIIISLASNSNQEANLQAARSQLTQLLTEVHFTSAIWTEPVNCIRKDHNEDGIVAIDLDLLQYDEEQHHLRDWSRSYVKDLMNEL